jgi:hypothetical protein
MISIEDLRSLGDPLKVFNFEVLAVMPGAIGAGFDDLRLRVSATSIPGVGVEPIVVSSGGHEVVYPGRIRYSHSWRVEIQEYENPILLNALIDWHQLVWNRTNGVQAAPTDYKTDIVIQLQNSGKSTVRSWTLIGAWPQEIGDVGLDYRTSADVKIPLTFAYDYFR